jgi:2-polyprenyl-3-methyl-5-hydroxy-6-metoxy-1,4-benzoquinol methylase
MFFKQKNNYQKIDGKKGRDCSERWAVLDAFVQENPSAISIDVGAAEGVFSKKIAEKTAGRVIAIEGSEHVLSRQRSYCEKEIEAGKILSINMALTDKNVDFFTQNQFDYCVLLAVLHWINNPDFVLAEFAKVSKIIFLELPELDDKKSWNQPYLKRIKDEFGTLEKYIVAISGKEILQETKVISHTAGYRRVFVLG